MISPREYNCASNDNEIYGDMVNIDFICILKECPYTIFKMIDVGSGCGKGLIYLCNSEIGSDLEYVCGIECNEYRYNKRPMLGDIRETKSLEGTSDLIAMLYRDEYYD